LTLNQMRVTTILTAGRALDLDALPEPAVLTPAMRVLALAIVACNNAEFDPSHPEATSGDPTEVALLAAAAVLGISLYPASRDRSRRGQFHFDPAQRLMSTVDDVDGSSCPSP
jgi:magnesium-transporting ATPase (P-type)